MPKFLSALENLKDLKDALIRSSRRTPEMIVRAEIADLVRLIPDLVRAVADIHRQEGTLPDELFQASKPLKQWAFAEFFNRRPDPQYLEDLKLIYASVLTEEDRDTIKTAETFITFEVKEVVSRSGTSESPATATVTATVSKPTDPIEVGPSIR